MRPTTAFDDNVFDITALLNPGTVFDHPRDVVANPSLSISEKRAILASWASDASSVRDQPSLRWLLGTAAPVRLSEIREAIARMATDRGGPGGAIVNISSRAAELGGAGEWIHYAASKGAVDSLTIGASKELAARGIRVNAVSPGLIQTDLHARAGLPDRLTRMVGGVPMGRVGSTDEVATAVLWLLSPEASYITGVIVPISGGR